MTKGENENTQEMVHTLKRWEKKWGVIAFNKKEIEAFFSDLRNKPFDMIVGISVLPNRKLDKKGYVWMGKIPLSQFDVGDNLRFRRRKERFWCVKKE